MENIYVVLIIQAVASGILCHIVATQKHQSETLWLILGLAFGVLAVIAVAGLPVSREWEEFIKFCEGQRFPEIKKEFPNVEPWQLPKTHPDYSIKYHNYSK